MKLHRTIGTGIIVKLLNKMTDNTEARAVSNETHHNNIIYQCEQQRINEVEILENGFWKKFFAV
ncbi:hypothetical protein T05_15309 [Trichinella murrelli]|uniref:Uncharacterized protein n=1 Tax=Trichinella murrelli TaxID=144512 RepID=A0A0V0TQI5_9BILA|nr:hypothetical protein T05_15309 [Trichinella murrelli]